MPRRLCLLVIVAVMNLHCCPDNLPDPAGYHFEGQEEFFEGWYLRATDPDSNQTFSFIYAVLNPSGTQEHSFAYMQAISGHKASLIYEEISLSETNLSPSVFDVNIGENHLSYHEARGAVTDGRNSCEWELSIEGKRVWEDALCSTPMGYGLLFPDVETYWHVIYLQANVTGSITWNGNTFILDKAPAYMEKNWGVSFPAYWTWMQANTFEDPDVCLSLSGGLASLSFYPQGIEGYAIGFFDGVEFHQVSSQRGAFIRNSSVLGQWHIEGCTLKTRIVIDATCPLNTLIELPAPTRNGMRPVAFESLAGDVEVRLYSRARKKEAWRSPKRFCSHLAGVELGQLDLKPYGEL